LLATGEPFVSPTVAAIILILTVQKIQDLFDSEGIAADIFQDRRVPLLSLLGSLPWWTVIRFEPFLKNALYFDIPAQAVSSIARMLSLI